MLSREEQDQIMRAAESLERRCARAKTCVARGEMSPKRAKEIVTEAKEELRDLLKEVG